jgi:dTDP-4-amino-4,6-dideoxygalactose transaminase
VDLDPIRELCDPHEITVIEDAASAVGSLYKGRPVGTSADLTVWSFHSDKVITTGEGGMLTTHRADWAARARRLREHSRGPFRPDGQESVEPLRNVSLEIGFNYCLTDLQAAVGTVQLRRLAQVVSRRREIAGMYVAGLAGLKGLRLVVDPPYGNTNFQSFWVEVLPGFAASREALLSRLEDAGISATSGTMAAHRQPAYRWRDTGHARLQHTDRLSDSTLVLPVFHELDTVTIYRIINTILTAGGGSVR